MALRNNLFAINSNLTAESNRPEKTSDISRRYHQKNDVWETSPEIPYDASPHRTLHYTDLSSASDWSSDREIFENLRQPVRRTTRFW